METLPAKEKRARTVLAGVIGNVLEWYDFGLFGFFAPIISQLFFPHESRLASLLQTFGIFALGYFMRPIGGVVFGHIGDRIGRKRALELSVLLMALPTTCIGLLPTYQQVGILAPLLLTLIRVLQGLSVGGEFIGSMTFLGEHASPARRGFWGSWTTTSAGMGMLLGSGVAALTTSTFDPNDLHGWGWRVPFLFGILVGGVGLWLRMGLAESPQFQQAAESGELASAPVMVALRRNFPAIVITFCLAMPIGIGFYIPFVWLSTWLAHINHPSLMDSDALTANTLALAASQLMIPLFGLLSDRVGRKPLLLAGTSGYILFTYPLFALMSQGTFTAALSGQLAFAVVMALCAGALPATFAELFPTQTRYSGIAVGYNASQALVGGTSPMVATWLIQGTHDNLAPALYLTAMMIVGMATLFWVHERAGKPLT